MSHHITRRIINERSDTPIPLSRWSLPRQKPGWRLLVERDLCPFTISSRSYLKLCIAHVEACVVSFLVCSTSDLVLYFIQMYSANIYKWHKWVFHLGHLTLPFLRNSIFTIKLLAFSVIHYFCYALGYPLCSSRIYTLLCDWKIAHIAACAG